MGRLRRLIEADEEVLLVTHSHWIRLVPSILVTLIMLGALGFGLAAWHSAPLWYGGVLAVLLIVVVARFISRFAQWHSTTLVITTERVIVRTGVLRRVRRELPLRRIGEVTVHQSLGSRIVGSGTLAIESGATSGSMTIHAVRHPSRVQRLLHEAIDGHESGLRSAVTPSPNLAGTPARSPTDFVASYAELLARGAITPSEYEQLSGDSEPSR